MDTTAAKLAAGMAASATAKAPEEVEEGEEEEEMPKTTREKSPVVEPCFYPVVKDALKPDPQVFIKLTQRLL